MPTAHRALSRALTLLAACSVLLASVAPAFAQTPLSGRVVDPQSRPVAGAAVVAVGKTSAPLSTRTDIDGRFSFSGLADGSYDITATAPGLVGEAHTVTVGGTSSASVDISLRISAIDEALVVSASQVDQPLSRVADSVTIITGDDIRARQLTSLGAALRTVPGFTVALSGGPGTVTSLFPRGGESDFTLVLVDGVRANSFGGGIDLSQVPVSEIERIEVVRGPQSAIYGADAIGGVVQVITRHGGAPMMRGEIEGGSRATRRLVGSTAGEAGMWRWQGGGDYLRDDGFTGTRPNSTEIVSNDDARERQAWVGTGWRGARGTDVLGTFRYVDTDRGSPGPYGSDPAHRFSGVDRTSRGVTARRTFGARVVQPWTGPASRVRQRIDVDVADFDLDFTSPFGLSESETRRYHGRVQTDAAINAAVGVSGGVEFLNERALNTFITAGTANVPVKRSVVGTFGEARWRADDRLTLQAGLRAEHIARESLAGDPSAFSPRPEFARDTVVSVNPKIAASWIVSPTLPADGAHGWTRIHASGGTGIRPPDAFEIAFTDNPTLKPERSKSVEAGVAQSLAGGGVQIDATAFFNQYDDLIVSVGSLRDVSRYRTDNVSNARARGLELGGAWQGAHGVSVRASYTFLDTEIREVDGSAQAPSPYRVGDALLRRPRHQGSIAATWTGGRFTAFSQLDARGSTLDAEPAFGPSGGLYENDGHTVVDLGGSFRVGRGLEAFARILNLFNRDYEEVFGYPSPGRTAFAGVRIAASR